jgi:hypothetical protein
MEDGRMLRVEVNVRQEIRRLRGEPCFVCTLLAGHPDYPHHDICKDDDTIAFLACYPSLVFTVWTAAPVEMAVAAEVTGLIDLCET